MSASPLVSICCITYNHAPYIRQCLDGFFMQQCDFDFEVLIHDDASTDGTQEIIKEYQQKYPDIIKPIFQTENQYSKGIRGINPRFNFTRTKGEYIALCEGDDYWTEPNKLQWQYEIMKNENAIMCTGDLLVIRTKRDGLNKVEEKKLPKTNLQSYHVVSPNSLHRKQFHYSHYSTFFINKKLIKKIIKNPFLNIAFGGDEVFLLEAFNSGKVVHLNKFLSVYRAGVGVTSGRRDQNTRCSIYKLKFDNYSQYLKYYNILQPQLVEKKMFYALSLTNCNNFSIIEKLKALLYFSTKLDYKNINKALNLWKSYIFHNIIRKTSTKNK